jgi:hypothetical protein
MPVKPERTEFGFPFRGERHAASRFRIIKVAGKDRNAPLGPRSSGREKRGHMADQEQSIQQDRRRDAGL